MKPFVKMMVAAMACSMFLYTACKKVSDAPVKTASTKDVAGLVGKDFTQALAGNYGGLSLKDNVKPPTFLTESNRKIVNSLNPLCGYTIDTTVRYVYRQGDSVKSLVKGRFVFTFTCSSTIPDGYKSFTSFTSSGKTPDYAYIYAIAQGYIVQALNAQYTKVSANGTLKSFGDFKYGAADVDTTHLANSIYQHQTYIMHNLVIDVTNNLDIISGTATFTSKGRNSFGKWEYIGTIEFIGNHKAIITINGQAYNVDLLTGVATPI